jgi:hypothetical protein
MAETDVARDEVLKEGQVLRFEIEVEVPGWVERVTVARPAQQGAVRRAVQRVLREAGLTPS